jgi:DNA-binding SARP family transcriptional activator/predicted ATPase
VALLAYLAVTRRAHARGSLAALFTEGTTSTRDRSQLRTILCDLRRSLRAYIIVTRDIVALTADRPVWLDLADLEAAAREETAPIDPARLVQAVSLCRGEFLAGLMVDRAPSFESWLVSEREQVKVLLARVLTRLIEHCSDQGDLTAAIHWARRHMEEEPWDEGTHRRLIRLLARTSQPEAALAQYEAYRTALANRWGNALLAEIPALYSQLRVGLFTPPSNLPAPQAGFIGREAELATITDRLADPACRLVTLVGIGGTGKSSLALRVAAEHARPIPFTEEHPFANGVYLVDLATVAAPRVGSGDCTTATVHRIATAVGRVLGLRSQAADPVAQLAAWLHGRAILLVLDNMEHLMDGAGLLRLLLERAERLKLLVTTRERLKLPEEWVVRVGGLTLPAGPEEVEEAAASSLYLQLLHKAGASAPPVAERADIVRICRLTQGLPLSLVLAARWAPVLPNAAIARELAVGMELLSAPGGRVPARQRNMRMVLQWTWGRLTAKEQMAMRRLATFQPGFTWEAAGEVARVDPATLLLLTDGMLISQDTSGRYAMHEFVRHYAAERLEGHPEEAVATRAAHALFYATLVQRSAPALRQTVEAQKAISADIANIRAAWNWAAEHADSAILELMLEGWARWHELQGLPGQAAEALEYAAARLRDVLAHAAVPDPSVQRLLGFILVEQADALNWQASYTRAQLLLEEARELARITASPYLEASAALNLGWLLYRQGDARTGLTWMQQSLALLPAAHESYLEVDTLNALGQVAMDAGEYRRAQGYLESALALCRSHNDRHDEAEAAYYLALIARIGGDFDAALRLLGEALQLVRALEYQTGESFVVHALGQVYDEGWGRHCAAERCFAECLRITQETADRAREGWALSAVGRNALYQGDLDRARAILGRALSLSQQFGSRTGATMALRGLSLLAHYLGDNRHARRCAEDALDITSVAGVRREERLALRPLGHAMLGLGDVSAALAAYQRAADLDEALGYLHLRCETATDLARVALAAGDTMQAAELVDAILPELEQATLSGMEEPALAYLTSYQVLQAADDARAARVLAAGCAFLEARAAQFDDEERRSQFLHALPAHRALLAAHHAPGKRTVPHLHIVRPASG